jgi:restriction endonuclease
LRHSPLGGSRRTPPSGHASATGSTTRTGTDINTLTVVATESYEEFADNLQKEIESDTGIRFGVVEEHHFANVQVLSADGQPAPLGYDQSKVLWEALKAAGHISAAGKVQDSLREVLKAGTLTLSEPFQAHIAQVTDILKKLAGRLEIRNADERRPVRPRQAVLNSAEFKALWDRIKHKTTYRVQFDNEKLVDDCIRVVQRAPAITKTRLQPRSSEEGHARPVTTLAPGTLSRKSGRRKPGPKSPQVDARGLETCVRRPRCALLLTAPRGPAPSSTS